MEELAKQFIHIMYSEAQLVSFGNSLLNTYDVTFFSNDGKNTPISKREVSHADVENWKEKENYDGLMLPSAHQIGSSVFLQLWSARIVSEIHAVHFYEGKVKYDLIVFGDNGEQTRLYNIDSAFVTKN